MSRTSKKYLSVYKLVYWVLSIFCFLISVSSTDNGILIYVQRMRSTGKFALELFPQYTRPDLIGSVIHTIRTRFNSHIIKLIYYALLLVAVFLKS